MANGTSTLTFVVAASLVMAIGCQSPYYADRGAAFGGVAGAVTGAALGDHQGNAAAGALLGSAVGAVTGAAIGDSIDEDTARRQAYIEQRTGRQMRGAVTQADVAALARSGLSDDVITNHIRANGVATRLTPSDIIQLHESGVSEPVINAMQDAWSQRQARPVMANGPPVVIEEHYMAPPYWGGCYRPPPPAYRHRYQHRPGVSWGFSYAR